MIKGTSLHENDQESWEYGTNSFIGLKWCVKSQLIRMKEHSWSMSNTNMTLWDELLLNWSDFYLSVLSSSLSPQTHKNSNDKTEKKKMHVLTIEVDMCM